MEVEEMRAQGCKFPRTHNNSNGKKTESANGEEEEHEQYQDEEEGDGEVKRGSDGGQGGRGNVVGRLDPTTFPGGGGGVLGRLYNWPSSRIVRVSRASGGKDRHSKVLTSKGLRDRRVRLSVPTAIQFYDLQDRLGYDQPSKAVEWLLTAAATSIAELPSISTLFPDTPRQMSDARRSSAHNNEQRLDMAEVEIDPEDENMLLQQQQDGNGGKTLCKSACSSTSETSKGSGSRSENRIKARERARERAAEKEKEKGNEGYRMGHLDPISQNSSFTELLTSGIHHNNNNNNHNPNGNGNGSNGNESNYFQKSSREWPTTSIDYFATGLLSPSSTSRPINSSNFLGQIPLGNPLQQPVSTPLFALTGDQNHHELPHFSFLPNHLVPVVSSGARCGSSSNDNNINNNNNNNNNGGYNLDFSVSSSASSGIAGFNRGTLQSNSSSSPSLLPYIQRLSAMNGPSAFFISATAPVTNANAVTPMENHYHHFLPGFDPQLQPCFDNTGRHHDLKGKGKN